jgi:hypothetical protein
MVHLSSSKLLESKPNSFCKSDLATVWATWTFLFALIILISQDVGEYIFGVTILPVYALNSLPSSGFQLLPMSSKIIGKAFSPSIFYGFY